MQELKAKTDGFDQKLAQLLACKEKELAEAKQKNAELQAQNQSLLAERSAQIEAMKNQIAGLAAERQTAVDGLVTAGINRYWEGKDAKARLEKLETAATLKAHEVATVHASKLKSQIHTSETRMTHMSNLLADMSALLPVASLSRPPRALDPRDLVEYVREKKCAPWVHLTSLLEPGIENDAGVLAHCLAAASHPECFFTSALLLRALRWRGISEFLLALRAAASPDHPPVFWIHRPREAAPVSEVLLANLRRLFGLHDADTLRVLQYDPRPSQVATEQQWPFGLGIARAMAECTSPGDTIPSRALMVSLYHHPEDPLPGSESQFQLSACNFFRQYVLSSKRSVRVCVSVNPVLKGIGYEIAEMNLPN